MIVLFAHIQTGQWSGIMPEMLTGIFGLSPEIRAIRIVEPDTMYTIGLIAGPREPITPLVGRTRGRRSGRRSRMSRGCRRWMC